MSHCQPSKFWWWFISIKNLTTSPPIDHLKWRERLMMLTILQLYVSIIVPNPLILLGTIFHYMNHSAILKNDKGLRVLWYFFLLKKGLLNWFKETSKTAKVPQLQVSRGMAQLQEELLSTKGQIQQRHHIYTISSNC